MVQATLLAPTRALAWSQNRLMSHGSYQSTPLSDRTHTLRPESNLLFYSSSAIDKEFGFIAGNGGLLRQYVNHRDEASPFCDRVAERFQAPLSCHAEERVAIEKQCRVGGIFGRRTRLHPDLEAIPTPGHCPGSTCFLRDSPEGKVLFTGDILYPSGASTSRKATNPR